MLISFCQTLFGYDQGVFGGVIVTDNFLNTLGIKNNASTIGTVTAIYDIGCFFGAIAAYFIGDRLGRKKTVLVGTTIMSVGAILQITGYSVAQMIVGRVIAGIGNGINTATGQCDNLSLGFAKLIFLQRLLGKQKHPRPPGEVN